VFYDANIKTNLNISTIIYRFILYFYLFSLNKTTRGLYIPHYLTLTMTFLSIAVKD